MVTGRGARVPLVLMLLATEAFVVVALCHEQLLEVGEAVKLAGSQSVVVQPERGTVSMTVGRMSQLT